MPYNRFGDLYKGEIVIRLNEMGCNIKDVHELNLIMEEMGLHRQNGRHWMTTQAGVKYTIFNGPVEDAPAWHPAVIDLIYDYLNK